MKDDYLRKLDLFKLVDLYFKQKYPDQYESNVEVRGNTRRWTFNVLLETSDGSKIGVVVKDWGRTLGVNQVRQLQKACNDVQLDGGVLISNTFSPSAVQYGVRYGVSCYSRYDLIGKL
ncbi:MAG: restriction endonuclease [Promethearchaeota archaeon]